MTEHSTTSRGASTRIPLQVDAERAEEFDKSFPHKELKVLEPIEVLLKRLPVPAQDGFRERGVKILADLNRFSGVRSPLGRE